MGDAYNNCFGENQNIRLGFSFPSTANLSERKMAIHASLEQ